MTNDLEFNSIYRKAVEMRADHQRDMARRAVHVLKSLFGDKRNPNQPR